MPRPGTWSAALLAPLLLSTGLVAPGAAGLRFVDVTADSGIDFVHEPGRSMDKHLPETMGAGVAWLDYDRDGGHDLYLVQSGDLSGNPPGSADANVLYRNRKDGTFDAADSGAEDLGYGMGVTAGDYDNDGWPDLLVTNFRANVLYRNNGDGTFSRQIAGVEDERWSSSAAWGDLDGDGDLDLYVTNYVIYDPATALACGEPGFDGPSYCHIDLFEGVADAVYRNRGDGTFVDVAEAAGVANAREGKGLGVVMGHLDDDLRTDIYVANDTQQNFLYVNDGDWTFTDHGLFSGTGYSEEGKAQAGMGTEMVDLDGDGIHEILVTNFAFENNNVYRRFAPDAYLDEAFQMGVGEPGLAYLAFGIVALDVDGDGDREIAIANGHILDTVERVQDGTAYSQPNHLFHNRLVERRQEALAAGEIAAPGDDWRPSGRLFGLVEEAGSGFEPVEVSRGLAAGDADADGRPELVVTNSGGPARLLRNPTPGGNRLVLRIRGRTVNRDALGTRVVVSPIGGDPRQDGAAGFPQHAEVRSASSYLSQGAGDLYFGLGSSAGARVELTWPDGSREVVEEVQAGQLVLLAQGRDPVVAALRQEEP